MSAADIDALNANDDASNDAPDPRTLLGDVFSEIATTASTLCQLAMLLQTNGINTMDDERVIQAAMGYMAERVGMLADLGAGQCGTPAVLGGVAAWTMPYAPAWDAIKPGAGAADAAALCESWQAWKRDRRAFGDNAIAGQEGAA
jgi:hypothetical protein